MKKHIIFVEIPVGGGLRIHFSNCKSSNPESYPTASKIQALNFVAYGCIPNLHNPVDKEPVDAFILGAENVPAGTEVEAVVIGIRLRNDGDHKLLTVACHSPLAKSQDLLLLSDSVLSIIGRWVEPAERPGEKWGSFEEAQQWLNQIAAN